MERTGLEHAQIDEHAQLTLVACYEHPSGVGKQEVELGFPSVSEIENGVGSAFRTNCSMVDSSILANGESFESWVTVSLYDPIFRYNRVQEEFENLEHEFGVGADLNTSASRIMITKEVGDGKEGIQPYSRPTIAYEAHINHEMPTDVLRESLSNVEATYSDFDYEGRHSKRMDLFIGDRNILYACSDGGRSGFKDANRISKLIDSLLSSKGAQYNGVFVSMFDSPRQKEL